MDDFFYLIDLVVDKLTIKRNMKKGIYLGAYKALHPGHDIVYQDINGKRDLDGDMSFVDLKDYDYIIATPPCNFYSRANWRRYVSKYALQTWHLLPTILLKLIHFGKPFIVENVRSDKLFEQLGLFDLPCFIYKIGRHTYWTNILLPGDLYQIEDNIKFISPTKRQGGKNVHVVIETFIESVEEL